MRGDASRLFGSTPASDFQVFDLERWRPCGNTKYGCELRTCWTISAEREVGRNRSRFEPAANVSAVSFSLVLLGFVRSEYPVTAAAAAAVRCDRGWRQGGGDQQTGAGRATVTGRAPPARRRRPRVRRGDSLAPSVDAVLARVATGATRAPPLSAHLELHRQAWNAPPADRTSSPSRPDCQCSARFELRRQARDASGRLARPLWTRTRPVRVALLTLAAEIGAQKSGGRFGHEIRERKGEAAVAALTPPRAGAGACL